MSRLMRCVQNQPGAGAPMTTRRTPERQAPSPRHPTVGAGPAVTASRWLEQYGGFVLIVGGAVELALATWKADKPAISPLLVIFGAGMVVLGAFYSRIAGNVEATRDGVKLVIREIDRFADEKGLSARQTTELITTAVARYRPRSLWGPSRLDAARQAANETVQEASQTLDARQRLLVGAFAASLREHGYDEILDELDDVDLIAFRRDEMLVAVLELASSVRRADVERAAERLSRVAQRRRQIRRVLVIPSEYLGFSLDAARSAVRRGLEIASVSDDGRVERLEAPYR
jgi:hypothetical protein